MSLPINSALGSAGGLASTKDAADVYTDFAGLAALKKDARTDDPDTLRAVAKQYESLFARMMIKSMRDAVGTDPIFGSDEENSYQGMYDDQLSLEITKGKGLGLADMLVRQMQKLTGGQKPDATQSAAQAAGAHANAGLSSQNAAQALRKYQGAGQSSSGRSAIPVASPEDQSAFITDVWPAAQEAGQQLGVDPHNLIAQAALETNWGTRVPRSASGRSSNNLFGVKAGSQWTGDSVAAGTQEFENGSATTVTGEFRAYDSRAASFKDYVALLRTNPRYAAALNTGSNVHAFASALQQGGYATDPDYANKVTTVAAAVHSRSATLQQPLKSASVLPLNPNTGIL